jgi:hypothetical protein
MCVYALANLIRLDCLVGPSVILYEFCPTQFSSLLTADIFEVSYLHVVGV